MWKKKWDIETGMTRKEIIKAEQLLDEMISKFYHRHQTIGTVYRTNSGIQRCYTEPMKMHSEITGICVAKKPTSTNKNYCAFTCDYNKEAVKANLNLINIDIYLRLTEEKFNTK